MVKIQMPRRRSPSRTRSRRSSRRSPRRSLRRSPRRRSPRRRTGRRFRATVLNTPIEVTLPDSTTKTGTVDDIASSDTMTIRFSEKLPTSLKEKDDVSISSRVWKITFIDDVRRNVIVVTRPAVTVDDLAAQLEASVSVYPSQSTTALVPPAPPSQSASTSVPFSASVSEPGSPHDRMDSELHDMFTDPTAKDQGTTRSYLPSSTGNILGHEPPPAIQTPPPQSQLRRQMQAPGLVRPRQGNLTRLRHDEPRTPQHQERDRSPASSDGE